MFSDSHTKAKLSGCGHSYLFPAGPMSATRQNHLNNWPHSYQLILYENAISLFKDFKAGSLYHSLDKFIIWALKKNCYGFNT